MLGAWGVCTPLAVVFQYHDVSFGAGFPGLGRDLFGLWFAICAGYVNVKKKL